MLRSAGTELRLGRWFDPVSGNTIVVALDHGLFMGPLPGLHNPAAVAKHLFEAGVDAIQSPPGQAVHVAPHVAARAKGSLLFRLDSTNMWRSGAFGPNPGFWTPIASPLDAVRAGADAAVCFLIAGWGDDAMEAANLRQIGQWASECADLGMPFMIEPLPLGPVVANENDATLVATLCRMAYELGATVIKSNYTGDPESFQKITSDVPVPVLMRGGPRAASDEAYLGMVRDAIAAGARGVVVGRNVFQADDPARSVAALRSIVHA
ncbi:MAG: aldolase [Thermomicrobiales bacterium]|nr:aldolase [Thermomicrobiales bacterium]